MKRLPALKCARPTSFWNTGYKVVRWLESIHGCDIGPAKGAVIFDGFEFHQLNVNELIAYAGRLPIRHLLSWDAPLTGPSDPAALQLIDGDLTQRGIESFFRQSEWGFRVPKGISVLGYGSCPHWTISQYVLGLPRIGRYSCDLSRLPFRPLFEQSDLSLVETGRGPFVVEVHPAVAMWLWCKESHAEDAWNYKRNTARVQALWKVVCRCVPNTEQLPCPKNDDQLDALVSWLLADRWVSGNGVVLLGNRETGSFLVPQIPVLEHSFAKFLLKRANGASRQASTVAKG